MAVSQLCQGQQLDKDGSYSSEASWGRESLTRQKTICSKLK